MIVGERYILCGMYKKSPYVEMNYRESEAHRLLVSKNHRRATLHFTRKLLSLHRHRVFILPSHLDLSRISEHTSKEESPALQ